jgi:hypothetical protein
VRGHRPMDRSLRENSVHGGVLVQMCAALKRTLTRLRLVDATLDDRTAGASDDGCGVVLPFPIRGEALLVKLADLLRDKMAGFPDTDPFALTISRYPRALLSIDQSAYVEFHADREAFHLIIDVTPDARVTLETGNFDTLVRFVLRYVAERGHDGGPVEVAS